MLFSISRWKVELCEKRLFLVHCSQYVFIKGRKNMTLMIGKIRVLFRTPTGKKWKKKN
jgi:hypothetical protein